MMKVIITEKLDGSNLAIFKLHGELHIAMRSKIFTLSEIGDKLDYKDLAPWIHTHGEYLQTHLCETSCICGEWIGMGKIGYGDSDIDKKFYMFAKANMTKDYHLENIKYDHDLFKFPFDDEVIPEFIAKVPIVIIMDHRPTIAQLDTLYEEYSSCGTRKVEGFVIAISDHEILKYVRYKNKKQTPHMTPEDMAELMEKKLRLKSERNTKGNNSTAK